MAHSPHPPPVPPKPRPRAQTLQQPNNTSGGSSPNATRSSYQQPIGTASQQRQWDKGVGTSVFKSPTKSSNGAAAASNGTTGARGSRRAVFCDVVVEPGALENDGEEFETGTVGDFIGQLGHYIPLVSDDDHQQPIVPRPSTPGKPPRVDPAAVIYNLRELASTEQSYLLKMRALNEYFAVPLRAFSKGRDTLIIPPFEANAMFGNISELVPISVAFEKDLRHMADQLSEHRPLPDGFGEMILSHVERMEPFRKWLSNHSNADSIRQQLETRNTAFVRFVQSTQAICRDHTQQTAGLAELLAEPFQRVSRYRLMLDPIIAHLSPDDPNVEPLQIAVLQLSDICQMRIDEETSNAAALWSLTEAVDGLPPTFINSTRRLLAAIDADEIVPPAPTSTSTSSTSLRCTLFLFNDCLLIAKRPSGESKTGKQYCSLHDPHALVKLYQTAHLTNAQASSVGTPKKLKKGVLGFRGLVDLAGVRPLDMGPTDFTFVLEEPPMDQNERWCGRPVRCFVVANTYANDLKRPEKEVWLNRLGEALVRGALARGAKAAFRSRRIWEGDNENSKEVYWAVWERSQWEGLESKKRSKLALFLSEDGGVGGEMVLPRQGNPNVLARASFLGAGQCRFSVRYQDRADRAAETISLDRIAPAIAELGTADSLYSLPIVRAALPSSSRSRPRSALLSAALDVFGGGAIGASSSSLKRGLSANSRASSSTTATTSISSSTVLSRYTNNNSVGRGPTPRSPLFNSISGRDQPPARGLFVKKSAPELAAPAARSGPKTSMASTTMGSVASRNGAANGFGREDSSFEGPSPISASHSSRHRRSSSLPPPPQPRFSPAPSPVHAQRELSPEPDYSFLSEFDIDPLDGNGGPLALDLPSEQSWNRLHQGDAAVTSPIAYRAPEPLSRPALDYEDHDDRAASPTPRRRVMGPRAPVTSAPASSPTAQPRVSPLRPAMHRTGYGTSPLRQEHPFARNVSGSAALSSSTSKRPLPPPVTDDLILEVEQQQQQGATPTSPQPRSPVKKKHAFLPSVSSSATGPMLPSISSRSVNRSSSAVSFQQQQRRTSSGSNQSNRRAASALERNRRVVSGASTVRGDPRRERTPDMDVDDVEGDGVFDDAERSQDLEMMDSDSTTSSMDQIRQHVASLRQKLSVQLSSKENERIISPPSLSRSPHTRNVYLKSTASPSTTSFSQAFTSARQSATSIDFPALLRWTEQLEQIILRAEAAAQTLENDTRLSTGPSEAEFATLDAERDMLEENLKAIKQELANLVAQDDVLCQDLDNANAENERLRTNYTDLANEITAMHDEFNKCLNDLVLSAQADFASSSLASPGATAQFNNLTSKLRQEMSTRVQAEQELAQYKRDVEGELQEKEHWGKLLREAGLI